MVDTRSVSFRAVLGAPWRPLARSGQALLVALVLVSGGVACGDDESSDEPGAGGAPADGHDHDHAAEEADLDACIHLEDGPAETWTAASSAEAAPIASALHTRHDITLVDVDGQSGGFVGIESDEAAEFALYLTASVPVTLRDADGAEVSAESTEQESEACSAIKYKGIYDLERGAYTLELGPTSAEEVSLVIVELGAHAHE